MRPGLAGFREPGFRFAGQVDSSGGGGGGSSDAVDITIADAGNYYTSTNVEGALQEAFAAVNLRAKLTDLASTAAGKGASLIGTNDPSLLIGGLHPTVEASLVSIAADTDAAQTDATTALTETQPILRGGTGQTTASAAFDALTVTAPALTSAATVDLSLAGCPGHYAIVNGNTGPITSFGTAPAGTERILRFASNPTVTHNAVSLILPGGADITMAAGDLLFLHSLGSGNWRATSYTRAASLPAYANDLASTSAGKGGSTIGLQDAGAYYSTKNVEAALQQLGPLLAAGTPTSLTATLSDAGTTTAPDLINIAHRSSGTPAPNFGLTVGRELDSSAKTRRRALSEVTQWTTATDGAETATHTFQLRTAGVPTNTLTLGVTSNFPTSGTAAAPTLTVGTVGDLLGLYRSSSGELGFGASGTRLGRWSSSGLLADTIFIGPVGSASSPTFTVNGTTGGTGLYGLSSGFSMSILNSDTFTATKGGAAFKFTALVPGSSNTASTEFVGFDVAMGRTSTWSTGALATQREMLVRKPTYAFGSASTITTTATLAIEGSPVAGSNATITNGYSLWTQAGTVRFDLADSVTTTAPDAVVQRHTTSGTAAAGYGLTNAIELQSAAGNVRRAMTDVTAYTTATDAAETASRTFQTIVAGSLSTMLVLGDAGANNSAANFPASGTSTKPTISLGPAANKTGISGDGSGFLYLICVGNTGLTVSSNQLGTTFPFITSNNGTASAISIGQSGGTGFFFSNAGLTVNVATATQTAVSWTGWTGNFAASTETVGSNYAARTRNWATGALTTQREHAFLAPTYAFVGASTITSAATVAISGAPIAGTNATITNAYSLWVQAGAVRFDSNFGFNKAPVAQQSTTGTATGFTAGAGTAVTDQSTFTGGTGSTAYRISDIVLALKNYGLLAA